MCRMCCLNPETWWLDNAIKQQHVGSPDGDDLVETEQAEPYRKVAIE